MSRFLFVVPPFAGHVNPTVPVAHELTERGHEVAWTGYSRFVEPLLPSGATLLPVGSTVGSVNVEDRIEHLLNRPAWLRGPAALMFLWQETLIPLAEAMAPGVDAAVDEFRPDVLVVDQQTLAGALVARRRALPWVTSATTSSELVRPLDFVPKVADWVDRQLCALQLRSGLSGNDIARGDLRFSEHLVIAFTTEYLLGAEDSFPPRFAFVGPALGTRPSNVDFPWNWLDRTHQRVLVSLGTVSRGAGSRFLCAAAEAALLLADRAQLVIVAPPSLLPDRSSNVLARYPVPLLELLPQVDAVVCHAGHNTVCESLAHGLPLVVAPIRDDQPVIAGQVVKSGAGVRVSFARVDGGELAAAIATVLDEPSYRVAAANVRESFIAAGGATTAAVRLERLVTAAHSAVSGRPP